MKKKIIKKKNMIYLCESIYFTDVMFILFKYNIFLSSIDSKIIINFKYLKSINTAILLLMINFIKICIKKNKFIKFINIPNDLIELGRLYNLNNIFYEKKFRGYHVKRKNREKSFNEFC